MDEVKRTLVALSAAIARQDRVALAEALDVAAALVESGGGGADDEPTPSRKVEEAILQSHLFVGYPAMIQALTAWRQREAIGAVAAGNPPRSAGSAAGREDGPGPENATAAGAIADPAGEAVAADHGNATRARPPEEGAGAAGDADGLPEQGGAEDAALWARRGERVCARIYGGQYRRLRSNIARLHPELDRWMVVDGYGRVLGRPGLDLATRELCIVALLCAQDAPRQLYSHLRGALNAGAGADEVEAAIRVAVEGLPAVRREEAWRTWRAVRGRAESSPSSET